MLIIAIGAIALGIVIAWLTRMFLDRVARFPIKVFLSLVSVFTGAATTQLGALFNRTSDSSLDQIVAGIYSIGLFCGFITYPLFQRYEALVRPRNRR
jgi:NhaP-type Na+/H+ or K+/H+ antiporter